jgi:uncharacterized small protein (TIGR04563 family)
MPQYLGLVRIDWHVAETPPELQPVLGDVNARLDSTHHTFETFEDELAAIASEQPRLVAEMLIDDGWRHYHLYRLERGKVTPLALDERPEDAPATPIDLPYDDVVGDLELEYDDEAELRETVTRAAAANEQGSFVAEVGDDRFLVEIEAGRARVRKLVFVGHHELAERLLRCDYPSPPPPPRQPTEKYELALYFPAAMLQEIQDEAVRTDESLSAIVQLAWRTAYPRIAKADRDELSSRLEGYLGGQKRKQTLYYPGAMIDQFEQEAARLDSSQSFVVQVAFVIGRGEIRKLPNG